MYLCTTPPELYHVHVLYYHGPMIFHQPLSLSLSYSKYLYIHKTVPNTMSSSEDAAVSPCDHDTTAAAPAPNYTFRFIYFNVRGAGELCRLVLVVSGFQWSDVRYPMNASAQGFAPSSEFRKHVEMGAFCGSMNKLPVLQVVVVDEDPPPPLMNNNNNNNNNNPRVVIAKATIGQSHSIIRFIARQHKSLAGRNALEEAKVDAIYECCRDIKSEWYRVKRLEGGKQAWFDSKKAAKLQILSLSQHCELLEKAIAANHNGCPLQQSSSPCWCMGGPDPTYADLAIYHLLGTPLSPMSGSTASFFDGEKERVEIVYASGMPRIRAIMEACSSLEVIQKWELDRPDTFT